MVFKAAMGWRGDPPHDSTLSLEKDPWALKKSLITLNFGDTDPMKKYHVVLKPLSVDGAV